MKSYKLIINIVRICIVFFIMHCFFKYKVFKETLGGNLPIEYNFIEKRRHSGGRGDYFTAKIEYNLKVYSISITDDIYKNIDSGVYPKLFYVTTQDEVISEWSSKKYWRLTVIGIVGLAVTFIPYRKK